jgi:hypothetical protein
LQVSLGLLFQHLDHVDSGFRLYHIPLPIALVIRHHPHVDHRRALEHVDYGEELRRPFIIENILGHDKRHQHVIDEFNGCINSPNLCE